LDEINVCENTVSARLNRILPRHYICMKPDVYCPSCGQPMRLVRALPHAKGERDDINVFECRICKVSFTTGPQADFRRPAAAVALAFTGSGLSPFR
jgi:transposase-like protein